jgi:hypothetical protein
MNDSVPPWFKSQLSNNLFNANVTLTKSSTFQLLYEISPESVPGPPFSIRYTTLFSHIISKSASNHHFYVEGTQLHMSFSTTNLSFNIR